MQKNFSSKLLNSHNLFGRTFGLLYLLLVIFQTRKLIVLVIFFTPLFHCRSGGLKANGFWSQESSCVKIPVESNNFSKVGTLLHLSKGPWTPFEVYTM